MTHVKHQDMISSIRLTGEVSKQGQAVRQFGAQLRLTVQAVMQWLTSKLRKPVHKEKALGTSDISHVISRSYHTNLGFFRVLQ